MIIFDKGGEWFLINFLVYDINGNKIKNCILYLVSWIFDIYVRFFMDLFFMNLCVLIDLIIKMYYLLDFVYKIIFDKRCR